MENQEDPHKPGMKLDKGKVNARLLMDFAKALTAVAEVGTLGAIKYTEGGWLTVPDAEKRYQSAQIRHQLAQPYEDRDPETGLLHLAHEAWNVMARLELRLRREAQNGKP